MKIEFTIDRPEHIDVVIERNWFTGKMTCVANGEDFLIKSPFNPATHFSLKLKKTYTVEVGYIHKRLITIEHTRPLLMGGLRPQEFIVSVDGTVAAQYKGF